MRAIGGCSLTTESGTAASGSKDAAVPPYGPGPCSRAYNGCMDGASVDRYLLTLRQHLPELAEKYHVRSLEVFGSYVRNEQTPESDLDVLVTFERAPGLFEFIELRDRLSDVLGVKVDLVMKKALKPRLKKRILHEAIAV